VLNAGGGSCVINITFTPGALGARAATVNVTDDAPGSPQQATLDGTGTQPGVILSSNSTDFGSVQVGTTQAAAAISLTNSGTGPLTITGITLAGANPGDFSRTTNCPLSPATLGAGANCTITPSMQPTTTGARAATISITSDAASSPDTISLTGMGVDFAISSSAAPPAITAGGTVNVTLTFDAIAGNTLNPTTFACSGLPPLSECIFTPPSLPAGSTDTQVALAIATTSNVAGSGVGTSGRMTPPNGSTPFGLLLLFAVGALGLLSLAALRQQPLRAGIGRLCLLALVLVAGSYLVGCAGNGFPEGASGTPPGSYTVTVTATSGTVQRTTTVTLTVQ